MAPPRFGGPCRFFLQVLTPNDRISDKITVTQQNMHQTLTQQTQHFQTAAWTFTNCLHCNNLCEVACLTDGV
ncbi:hypothetical protein Y1Q_0016840 [Alligator mississippiensis]|uniref:Uncharacterized protein n=1 Tax=Alligator mississippiensis TaxID=8496 RepID=A0A151P6M7_ALLMI|nr:hypothetical protein Y1Q_0016840 [Alligator mississippiensis]